MYKCGHFFVNFFLFIERLVQACYAVHTQCLLIQHYKNNSLRSLIYDYKTELEHTLNIESGINIEVVVNVKTKCIK